MNPLQFHMFARGDVVTPPQTDPLAWRGDWLNWRFEGKVNYLGDLPANDAVCRAYLESGYTDILVASNLGPQPGADEPFDLFGSPDEYANRVRGFSDRGVRAIGQIGFEDNWTVWAKYANNFPAHLRRLVEAADPFVSSWLWGVEIDEGIAQERYTWDDLITWMVVLAEVSDRPQAVWMRQTSWGPEGDTPWHGGRQAAWWRAVRKRLPNTRLAMAFQHRHDQPSHQRPNHGFLSPEQDVIDHVQALLTPERLGNVDVKFIAAEYAWNGTDPTTQGVTEAEAAELGQLALSLGAHGALNGV